MKTRIALIVTLLVAVVLPLVGYILEGLWWGIAGSALAGLLWYLGLRYQRGPLVHLAFAGLLSLDAFVMLIQPVAFGLIGGFAALAAWDLSRFYPRLKAFSPLETAQTVEKQHLLRLGAVIVAGLVLAGLIQLLQFKFNFVVSFFLSLLVLIGVRLIGRALLKSPAQPDESDEK